MKHSITRRTAVKACLATAAGSMMSAGPGPSFAADLQSVPDEEVPVFRRFDGREGVTYVLHGEAR